MTERLEEIKEAYRWTIDNSLVPRLSDSDTDWLINRVEELEKKLSINANNMKQLQKQNQYYKQALEKIRGLYPLRNVGYQVSEIRKIVIKALEGTDNE